MIRTNKTKRVRMLRDANVPAGRLLKGLVLKLPEREAMAMIAAGMAVEVQAPVAPPKPAPKAKAKDPE
jgi:hypothetical protein